MDQVYLNEQERFFCEECETETMFASSPCECCIWCEMFPCECTDDIEDYWKGN